MQSNVIASNINRVRTFFEAHPARAVATDKPATAVWAGGLSCRVEGFGGSIDTDMAKALGGNELAPSPGWYARAAVASCTATAVAMRAAELEIDLDHLEVRAESQSDNRGLLGLDGTGAEFLSAQITVEISSSSADDVQLAELVKYADEHSPVGASLRAAIPTTIELEIINKAAVAR